MAAIYTRVILPPSRTICLLFAILLLFGTNVTLVILRTMMSYAHDRAAAVSSGFNDRLTIQGHQSLASMAAALGCSYIGNGSLETGSEQMKCKRRVLKAAFAMDQSGVLKDSGFKEEYETAVIGTPLQPVVTFANPCWFSASNNHQKERLYTVSKMKLRCLPTVLLLASGRSGVNDISEALELHPKLYGPSEHVSSTPEIEGQTPSFSKYVDKFDNSAKRIRRIKETSGNNDKVFHEELIFDVEPRYIQGQIQSNVLLLKGNQTVSYIPSILRLLTPKIKIIFMLRDPIERSFSDFCSVYSPLKYGLDIAKAFDSLMREAILIWHQCIQQYDELQCLTDLAVLPSNKHRMALNILMNSLYVLHVEHWTETYSLSQMLFIRSEDYFANRAPVLNEVTNFLRLDRYPEDLMRNVSAMRVINRGRTLFLMWDKTRKVLEKFFAVYNGRLVALLKDDRFSWSS